MKLTELMDVCRSPIDLWDGDNDKYLGSPAYKSVLDKYRDWTVHNFTVCAGEDIVNVVIRKE